MAHAHSTHVPRTGSPTPLQQPPARLAAGALETLSRAAPRSATPVHRAQLLVERGKLLQLMARAEAAEAEVEQAAALLTTELERWREAGQGPGGAAGPSRGRGQGADQETADAAAEGMVAEAGPAAAGAAGIARSMAAASAALSTLLDAASTLRQLGREARANELLTGTVAVASALGAANSYLRGVAQLSELSGASGGERLEPAEVFASCQAAAQFGCTVRFSLPFFRAMESAQFRPRRISSPFLRNPPPPPARANVPQTSSLQGCSTASRWWRAQQAPPPTAAPGCG